MQSFDCLLPRPVFSISVEFLLQKVKISDENSTIAMTVCRRCKSRLGSNIGKKLVWTTAKKDYGANPTYKHIFVVAHT
jgi:hypothetical protein